MTKDLRHLLLDRNRLPLPKQELLQKVAARSAVLGMACYLVGGFVRDILLEKPVNDYDFVVEGDAIKLGRALVREFGGKLATHPKFKTATWYFTQDEFIDLSTARLESYEHPGALPIVQASTIADDLHRRDFTINAMAVRLDGDRFGELFDPLGGQSDLKSGLIRVAHPRSFLDDPTRMLRAVRYEKRYTFQIESDTLDLFDFPARAVLSKLSGERLRHEFDLMFEEESVLASIGRAAELGLLNPVHPALMWDEMLQNRFSLYLGSGSDRENLWAVWLMSLSEEEIKSIGRRLRFRANTLKTVLAASAIFHDVDSFAAMSPSQCVESLERQPEAAVVSVADSIPFEKPRAALDTYLSKWKNVKSYTTGLDLKKRGLPPSPRYKEVLRRIRAAWLDGEVQNAGQEIQLLESLLKEKGAAR